jgi:DnaK suppressor protein
MKKKPVEKVKTKISSAKVKQVKSVKIKPKATAKPVKIVVKAKSKPKVANKSKADLGLKKKTLNPANLGVQSKKVKLKLGPKEKEMVVEKRIDDRYLEIKKILEQQKRSLLADAGATLESTLIPVSEGFPDWTDQASVEVDQNCILRLREREQHLLNKIEDAIERINGDTYGICEICSEPISIKRLKARPVTTLCIECKTRQEVEEKMRQ